MYPYNSIHIVGGSCIPDGSASITVPPGMAWAIPLDVPVDTIESFSVKVLETSPDNTAPLRLSLHPVYPHVPAASETVAFDVTSVGTHTMAARVTKYLNPDLDWWLVIEAPETTATPLTLAALPLIGGPVQGGSTALYGRDPVTWAAYTCVVRGGDGVWGWAVYPQQHPAVAVHRHGF